VKVATDHELPADGIWAVQSLDALFGTWKRGEAEPFYPLQDANGNVTSLMTWVKNLDDQWRFSPVERYVYDPHGRPFFREPGFPYAVRSASAYGLDVLYAGYRYDAETGLYHVRRRMLHPTLGVWLTPDPQGYADSFNLYQYCAGSPLSYTDPTGELLGIIVDVGFIIWDTTMYFTGNISGSEYAWRMGVNALALGADILSGGLGIGAAARTGLVRGVRGVGRVAMRAGQFRSIQAAARAGTALGRLGRWAGVGRGAQIAGRGIHVYGQASDIAQLGIGAYGVYSAISEGEDTLDALDAMRMGAQGLKGDRRVAGRGIMNYLTRASDRRFRNVAGTAHALLEGGEVNQLAKSARWAKTLYGKVVERAVHRRIRDSRLLRFLFRTAGGPNRPDVVGRGLLWGLNFDITSDSAKSVADHMLNRRYSSGLILNLYRMPDPVPF